MSEWKYTTNTTKPGNPLWNEYVNENTGQSTLEILNPVKISKFDTCKHYYVVDGHDAICRKCGLGQRFILGKQMIKKGKLIRLDQKNKSK